MKPRSCLTTIIPKEADENRRKYSKFQLLDPISPEIRKSVEQCMADLNKDYKSSLRVGSIKKILRNQRNKRKSIDEMATRRKLDRYDYLNSRRQGEEIATSTPSSSTVGIEPPTGEGASSLESLRQLVTEQKEYLEMSQIRKQKVQWYERVTRQSKQLLHFLRANDKSAGDTSINNAANLVLTHAPATDPSGQQAPPAPPQPMNRGVGSARPELTAPVQGNAVATTAPQISIRNELTKPRNDIAVENRRKRIAPGTSNIAKTPGKRIRMATPTRKEAAAQQTDSNGGAPTTPAGRVMKKIQEARLALATQISGNHHTETGNELSHRKKPGKLRGDDKENGEPRRLNPYDPSVIHKTPDSFRQDGFQFNRTTAAQNINNINNSSFNIGVNSNREKGSSPNRKIVVHSLNQISSAIKRKRINSNTRPSRTEAMGQMAEAKDSGAEASGLGTEARRFRPEFTAFRPEVRASRPEVGAPRPEIGVPKPEMGAPRPEVGVPGPEDSLWTTIRKMWKKQEKGGAFEGEAESPWKTFSTEDDPIKGGTSNTNKTPTRRLGRAAKRRRREARTPPAQTTVDDEIDYVFPVRSFVIPDKPYEVEEALSMDLINSAYDFIHNG